MSRIDEMHVKTEATDVGKLLADLIARNSAVTVELKALAQLVEVETVSAREREAETAARLGEALVELAEANAAVETEKKLRVEAEERAATLTTAVGLIQGALATLPSAHRPDVSVDTGDDDTATISVDGGPVAAIVPDQATPVGEPALGDDEEPHALPVGAEDATVSIVVTLTVAEAAGLDRLATLSGDRDRAEVALDLIRDGLGRSGAAAEGRPLLE